jgi:acyl-CoA thioester hydrolase
LSEKNEYPSEIRKEGLEFMPIFSKNQVNFELIMKLSFVHETTFRIRYSETDKMGFCYHGNYAAFFEMGRVEALRSLGVFYAEWERQGILLPVLTLETRFNLPLRYDEQVRMITRLIERSRASLLFEYEIFNEANQCTTTGNVTLVCVDDQTKKLRSIPVPLIQSLKPYEIPER